MAGFIGSAAAGGGSSITGSGTPGMVAVFVTASSIGDAGIGAMTANDNANNVLTVTQQGTSNANAALFRNSTASNSGIVANFRSANTSAVTVPLIAMQRDSSAAGNQGMLRSFFNNSTGTPVSYGDAGMEITSNAAGAQTGDYVWKPAGAAGALTERMRLTGSSGILLVGASAALINSTDRMVVYDSQNQAAIVHVHNGGSNTLTEATFVATCGSGVTNTLGADMHVTGLGWTPMNGQYAGEACFGCYGVSAVGVAIRANGALPIRFVQDTGGGAAPNGELARFSASTPAFLIGFTATNGGETLRAGSSRIEGTLEVTGRIIGGSLASEGGDYWLQYEKSSAAVRGAFRSSFASGAASFEFLNNASCDIVIATQGSSAAGTFVTALANQGSMYYVGNGHTFIIGTTSSSDLVFFTSSVERFRIVNDGGITINAKDGGIRINNQTTGSAAQVGTLTNSPVSGNPTFWLPISIAGATKYMPCW